MKNYESYSALQEIKLSNVNETSKNKQRKYIEKHEEEIEDGDARKFAEKQEVKEEKKSELEERILKTLSYKLMMERNKSSSSSHPRSYSSPRPGAQLQK